MSLSTACTNHSRYRTVKDEMTVLYVKLPYQGPGAFTYVQSAYQGSEVLPRL